MGATVYRAPVLRSSPEDPPPAACRAPAVRSLGRIAASFFTHVVLALVAGRLFFAQRMPLRFWIAACALSALPDADALLHFQGVPYEHPFGHRGFAHSPFFAAIAGGVVALWLFRDRALRLGSFLFLAGASHGVLDAMTDGGLGVAFLAPFSNERFFFPWRPLVVAPIGVGPFFSEWGLKVLASEIVWVWLPLLGLLGLLECARWARHRPGRGSRRS